MQSATGLVMAEMWQHYRVCANGLAMRRSPEPSSSSSTPSPSVAPSSPPSRLSSPPRTLHAGRTVGSSSVLSSPPPSVLSVSASDTDVAREHAEASDADDAWCASFWTGCMWGVLGPSPPYASTAPIARRGAAMVGTGRSEGPVRGGEFPWAWKMSRRAYTCISSGEIIRRKSLRRRNCSSSWLSSCWGRPPTCTFAISKNWMW